MHGALAGERATRFSVSASEFAAVMNFKFSGEEGSLAHEKHTTPSFYFDRFGKFLPTMRW